MEANKNDNEQVVWNGTDDPRFFGAHVECPGIRRCIHWSGMPDYYLIRRTLRDRSHLLCFDKKLWLDWQHRQQFEIWCRTLADGTLEDLEVGDRPVLPSDAADDADGWELARRRYSERKSAIQVEFTRIVELAGEPEIKVFEHEVAQLLDQIVYALDAFFEACPAAKR